MRSLMPTEISSNDVHGGSIIAAAVVGGLVNSVVWGGWTTFVDNKPEKVTPKKCLLTFALGAIATATGTWML